MTCSTTFILTDEKIGVPGQANVPHPAIKDKQAQNGQSMQANPAEQAHQSEAHGRAEQDVVMDDAGD